MMNLTDFEQTVLRKFLEGKHPVLQALNQQLNFCSVSKREMTGYGFYVYFEVTITPQIPSIDIRIGDVIAEIPELKNGAGFVLYVKNGKLDMLEGYSYDEPWPDVFSTYYLKYISGEERDWIALENAIERSK